MLSSYKSLCICDCSNKEQYSTERTNSSQLPSCFSLPKISLPYLSSKRYPRSARSFGNTMHNWMAHLDDNNYISLLNIPGTHQTLSLFPGPLCMTVPICQTWSLLNQLLSGIRYIDVRVRTVNKSKYNCFQLGEEQTQSQLELYHGIVYQRGELEEDVLKVISEFLFQHNSETIIMNIKSDGSKEERRLEEQQIQELVQKYQHLFYFCSDTCTQMPQLKQIRGKILLLPYYNWKINGFSMQHLAYSSILHHQDNYELEERNKQTSIHIHNIIAEKYRKSRQKGVSLFINNINSVRWNKWPFTYALKLNKYVFDNKIFQGIIALDFPGEQLIEEIILSNFPNGFFQSSICSH